MQPLPHLVLEVAQQPGEHVPTAIPNTRPSRAVTAVERKVLLNRGHQAGLPDMTQR